MVKVNKNPATKVNRRKMPGRKVKQVRVTIEPVLACDRLKRIAKRKDKAELKVHYTAIERHRLKYAMRIKALRDAKAGITKGYVGKGTTASIPGWKAKMTEAAGEDAATDYVVQQEPSYFLRTGFAAGTGFDQVWYDDKAKTFLIVEAKGFGASLSTNAAKGPQMSREWVDNTLIEIITSPTKSDAEKEDAKQMRKGINVGPPPKVRGMVIMATKSGGAVTLACPDGGKYTTGL